MATILLSAAGAAIGGSMGGTLLGLSMTAVGRFAGATLGRSIDQRLLGQGSDVVESGRVERFRLTGSGEGDAIAQVYGRMRVAGHVIWATEFAETVSVSGGKGTPSRPKTRHYSYSVSLAIALCEGEITRVGRIWADGVEIAPIDVNMRVYTGAADQLPDPKMEAVEGSGAVPAYRGTAYVVFEDLALEQFGNRVPQFTFEVVRPHQASAASGEGLAHLVRGVAMMPGSGEYTLATTPVQVPESLGKTRLANINTPSGLSDFQTSLQALRDELPNCGSTSLIVSWFGDDLRCGTCTVQPKVEQQDADSSTMPWRVAGLSRAAAALIAQDSDGRPVYGGTPADASVIEAIEHLRDSGQEVMYYPFILMDQQSDNTLPDPWSNAEAQPAFPWRGRITLSEAPGQAGSPDGTASADSEVAAFFGTATAAHFAVNAGTVSYSGPSEWSYRRFILHNAALCLAAGGVDSFCIGSEMRSLTQIRGAGGVFVAVQQLRQLAAEVRAILGAEAKIGYAADWSEYFGYQPQDGSNDRYFHLDPLWGDDNIDFIGIDNYMPLSDWREGDTHRDAHWGSIYDPAYLASNIEGGEGYDWYYHSPEARAAQIRTPIEDGDHQEPWIYRYKDIRNWWANEHHERIDGQRVAEATDWQPQSKPIWFTELGCAAIDKGTNQPNKFLDPKSSESSLPRYSNGRRDDLMQMQYLKVMHQYWAEPANNPQSSEYSGQMLDLSKSHVWAWDARPFPFFPNNRGLWSDGANYAHGHWISGRMSGRSLASVVGEICERAGVSAYDTSTLWGYVRGYVVQDVSEARSALQPLMLRYGFDAVERDGVLKFLMRDGKVDHGVSPESFAVTSEIDGIYEVSRTPDAELAGRVRLRFVQADADFEVISEETVLPDSRTHSVAASELPIALTRSEGRQVVERWLSEARIARDSLRLALPPSRLDVAVGDVIRIDLGADQPRYRVDQIEHGASQLIEAVRIDQETYQPVDLAEELPTLRPFVAPTPVFPLFMDLPLMTGAEVPHAPHVAITATPWPGSVAVYSSGSDDDYVLNQIIAARATIGQLTSPLFSACPGLIDRGQAASVKLASGTLTSISDSALLAGENLAAIGDGTPDGWELIQFRDAELIDKDTFLISHRLRGQLGSDAAQLPVWPVGSYFVLLDGTTPQIALSETMRNIARHYRIGPAQRGYDDPSYQHFNAAFAGIGLRPYSPCHVRAMPDASGALALSWIRRTRIAGDSWDGIDVPLGEESESYLLRVIKDDAVIREVVIGAANWTYSAQAQAADGISAPYSVNVSQISAIFGAGPFASIAVTA